MAHLWIQQQQGEWAVLSVTTSSYDLTVSPPRVLRGNAPVELMRVDREWVLLAAPDTGVRVNGLPVMANIHVLADRDEITVYGERMYFSTEVLAVVDEFAGPAMRCPRCKLEVPGGEIVRCPGCKAVHHKDCWTYAPACSLCPTPTPLDAGFQWTPEGL